MLNRKCCRSSPIFCPQASLTHCVQRRGKYLYCFDFGLFAALLITCTRNKNFCDLTLYGSSYSYHWSPGTYLTRSRHSMYELQAWVECIQWDFGPLHVVWQVSFGCWITWSISCWQNSYMSVFFPKAEWWVAKKLVCQQLRPQLSAKWILSILSDLPFTRKTEKNVYFPILQIF